MMVKRDNVRDNNDTEEKRAESSNALYQREIHVCACVRVSLYLCECVCLPW